MAKKIAVLGDVHLPWCHKPTLSRFFEFVAAEQPDYVIQVGDLYDMLSHTRFARSLDVTTPKQEITEARVGAEEIWRIVQKRAPKAVCYQILGNHDVRPMQRVFEKYPEIASLIDLSHLWKFDGVNTVLDEKQELEIEGILFMHGFRSKLGDHAKYNQQSTVCGHSHRGGVHFFPVRNQIVFELNAGYVADPTAAALSYGKQKLINWTHGWGFVDEFGPRFIPVGNSNAITFPLSMERNIASTDIL